MMAFPYSFLFVTIIAATVLLLQHTIEAARVNVFTLQKSFHTILKRKEQQTRLTFPYSSFSTTASTASCNNIVGGHLALIKKKKKRRRSSIKKQQQQQAEQQQEFEETTESYIQTEAAELARLFSQVVVDELRNDVHVGRLLIACEQLAEANRNVGFTQSAYDILGNIKKVKSVYDQYPNKAERDSISALIQYELELGVHKDPTRYLTKNSAAMGFLWLARNINYQYDMFSQMIGIGDESDAVEPYDAAITAYERALKPHLSKPLQRVGQAALGTLKPYTKETIMSRIGGFDCGGNNSSSDNNSNNNNNKNYYGLHEQDATIRDMKLVLQTWQPMLTKCQQVFIDLNLEQHDI